MGPFEVHTREVQGRPWKRLGACTCIISPPVVQTCEVARTSDHGSSHLKGMTVRLAPVDYEQHMQCFFPDLKAELKFKLEVAVFARDKLPGLWTVGVQEAVKQMMSKNAELTG